MNTKLLAALLLLSLQTWTSAALRTWDGGGTNNNWTTATNWVGDVAPLPGDDLLFPTGKTRLSPINDFPSGTTFNSIIFSGTNYSLDGNSIALNAGIIATNATGNMVNNPLSLNSDQTFTVNVGDDNLYLLGPIDTVGKTLTLSVTAPSRAQMVGIIGGTGGLIKVGSGTALLYGDNTFSGPVQLNEGFLSLYHANALGATNGNTTVAVGTTLGLANQITVREPLVLFGTLKSFSGQSKTWAGPIALPAAGATFATDVGSALNLNTVISGTNGFTKISSGLLVLNSNNTYVGTTVVDDGTLQVNGYQPDSPILLNRVTLAGKGTVGSVTSGGTSAKILNPGLPLAAAILTCSNLTLSGTTSFQVELNGTTPGSGYDQLVVNGSVSLNNATFAGAVGFAPAPGDTFVIINNDGNDPVNGIFLGLTNGAPLVLGTNLFQISYTGGDGNDVVLARIRMPARFESVTQLPNGQEQIRATGGFAGLTYTVQAAPSLNPVIQWSNLGTATANASGVIDFTDTNAPLFPMRFYRALSP